MSSGNLEAFNITPITTATTTLVKTGNGFLRSVFVSSVTGGTFTVYDNTTATGTPIVATVTPSAGGVSYTFPCGISTGITIVTTGTISLSILWL